MLTQLFPDYRPPPGSHYPSEIIPLQHEAYRDGTLRNVRRMDGMNSLQHPGNAQYSNVKIPIQTLNRHPTNPGVEQAYDRALPPIPPNTGVTSNMQHCNGTNGFIPANVIQTMDRRPRNTMVTMDRGYNTMGHKSNGHVNQEMIF